MTHCVLVPKTSSLTERSFHKFCWLSLCQWSLKRPTPPRPISTVTVLNITRWKSVYFYVQVTQQKKVALVWFDCNNYLRLLWSLCFVQTFEHYPCLETDKEKLRKETSDAPSLSARPQCFLNFKQSSRQYSLPRLCLTSVSVIHRAAG